MVSSNNDGVSKLSGRLPPHPGRPDKKQHKKGIQVVEVKSDMSSSPIAGYFSGEYDGQELDPVLFLVETEVEYDVDNSKHPFNHDEWILKSGLAVIDLLKIAAGI
ncbi:20964_t:CDS:2 [Entrophospora sp. SA101]|nr:20964_t:CDS:2 [Entrophospora sp. SA101]